MRCSNCGWDNNESRNKCEKCNSNLLCLIEEEKDSDYQMDSSSRKTVPQSLADDREEYVSKNTVSDMNYTICPECNYPLFPDNQTCPKCGNELTAKHNDDRKTTIINDRKTINPWDFQKSVSCRLKKIQNDGEDIAPETLTFSGESTVLNRANTDENNITITSKEQALLSHENNKWYIQDKSEQKTTFIRTSGKVELKSGDIIMLGNRLFEFES